jgi:hypothetical protein
MSHDGFLQICEKMECRCDGAGSIPCSVCKGRQGKNTCANCSRTGRVVCPECDGRGMTRELTTSQLQMILKAELRVEERNFEPNRKSSSWNSQLSGWSAAPVRELTVETLTEIDPRQCLYRDGKWVQPQ